MHVRNTIVRWGAIAQGLHWLIVALLIAQVTLALLAAEKPLGLTKLALLARHKSIGITILALVLLRLAWRAMNPVPLLPPTLKPYERTLARLTHAGLYAVLIAMPLTGWIMSSARSFAVSWFGLWQLPDLVRPDPSLFQRMVQAHLALAVLLGVLVALHVGAALKHHFVLKDDVLRRMLPFGRSSRSA